MWLIHTASMRLEEFTPPQLPRYAILSHTWEEDEVTFREFQDLESAKNKAGFAKIQKTCELAARRGIFYAWVDTCCIDKSSSAELSEAINSMFEWYRGSEVCFAYLSDLQASSSDPDTSLWRDKDGQLVCRWFERGWTLQELLAPARLEFYDSSWNFKGFKTDPDVMRQLSDMTGIRRMKVFQNSKAIRLVVVGERMSWAARRQTKRLEDLAYCLLGIFQVNMPMLYGEGTRAFQRLQEEIIKTSTDMSLFCWKADSDEPPYRGLLANSPAEFSLFHEVIDLSRESITWSALETKEFAVTNKGVRIDGELLKMIHEGQEITTLRCTCNLRQDAFAVLLPLKHYRDNVYVRERPTLLLPSNSTVTTEPALLYAAKNVGSQMVRDLLEHRSKLCLMAPKLPPGFRLVTVSGWPKLQWVSDDRWFLPTSTEVFTCFLVRRIEYLGECLDGLVTICQWNASSRHLDYALVSERKHQQLLKRLAKWEKPLWVKDQTVGIEHVSDLRNLAKLAIADHHILEVETKHGRLFFYIDHHLKNVRGEDFPVVEINCVFT